MNSKKGNFFFLIFSFLYFSNQLYAQLPVPPDSLPQDFPGRTVLINDNPTPGYIFLSNFVLEAGASTTPYLMILDNSGYPVFYRKMNSPLNLDFKIQPAGVYSYFSLKDGKFYTMDMNYSITDSFYCTEPFTTDEHELRLLPNGHTLLLGVEIRTVDMSGVVPGGRPNARVSGFVIQEFDPSGNLLFQWETFDHFQITDATDDIDLTALYIDYAHCNAIEVDTDGNLLLSTRHMDEITKIDRTTGDIIWRWGGSNCENNEFTFLNDTVNGYVGFSHQHAVRRLPNGNILLYDNGNLKSPQYSRAVEYQLDEVNKTAYKVWEFRHSPDIYTSSMGFTQRLDNGSTIIGWGQNEGDYAVSEVRPDGTTAFELKFPDKVYSYRAFKFPGLLSSIQEETEMPTGFSLEQNYPNPFNPSTKISFSIPEAGQVTLTIYSALGEEIVLVVREMLMPGVYTYEFNAEGFSSGIYYYRLAYKNSLLTKKMLLLR